MIECSVLVKNSEIQSPIYLKTDKSLLNIITGKDIKNVTQFRFK